VTITQRELAPRLGVTHRTIGNRLQWLYAAGMASPCRGRTWRTPAGGYVSDATTIQLFLPAEWVNSGAEAPTEDHSDPVGLVGNFYPLTIEEESEDSLPSESVPAKEAASRWVTDPPPKPPPPPPPRTGPTSLEAALTRLGASISSRSAPPSIPPGNEKRLE